MNGGIEAHDLRLRYDDTEALCGLTFRLEPGTICGLLGRNGSGKTSLLSLLAARRRPTAGTLAIDGEDPFENPRVMAGVALVGPGGECSVHDVGDVLRITAALRPTWDDAYARRLLDRFEVPRRKKVKALSRGQQAALSVACGLAARAPVTLFDEAHLGMDAPSRMAFYDELLAECLARPRTVVLSTHHIDEVASLFNEVLVLDRGRLLVHDDVDALRGAGAEVVGPADAVARFTAPLDVLATRELGPTRAAVVYGGLDDDQRRGAAALGLQLEPLPLQDLVVHLTTADRPPREDQP